MQKHDSRISRVDNDEKRQRPDQPLNAYVRQPHSNEGVSNGTFPQLDSPGPHHRWRRMPVWAAANPEREAYVGAMCM